MMFGMFGFGLLILLLVIGLPILLVVMLFIGGSGILQRMTHPASVQQTTQNAYPSATRLSKPAEAPSRYCAHCGAGLQSNWTHCPQCGAPIQ
jgi:uncharacterized membrane protein